MSGCQAQCSLLSGSYDSFGLPSDAGTFTGGQACSVLDPVRQVGDLLVGQRLPSLGIRRFGFLWLTRLSNRLSSGSPGTTAGPLFPPASRPLRSSTRRPPAGLVSAEWHV